MPRRGQISKREVLPDPMYHSELVTKLINNIMLDGKKGVAQKIVCSLRERINSKISHMPLSYLDRQALSHGSVLILKQDKSTGSAWRLQVSIQLLTTIVSITMLRRHFC